MDLLELICCILAIFISGYSVDLPESEFAVF